MNFVGTCHTEYDTQRMILDVSDATVIRYPAAQVDEEDAGDSTVEVQDDDDNLTMTMMMWIKIFNGRPWK